MRLPEWLVREAQEEEHTGPAYWVYREYGRRLDAVDHVICAYRRTRQFSRMALG